MSYFLVYFVVTSSCVLLSLSTSCSTVFLVFCVPPVLPDVPSHTCLSSSLLLKSFLFFPSLFASSCVSHLSPGPVLYSCLPLSVSVLPRVPLGLLRFYSYGFLCCGLCFGHLPLLYWASLCLPLLPYPLRILDVYTILYFKIIIQLVILFFFFLDVYADYVMPVLLLVHIFLFPLSVLLSILQQPSTPQPHKHLCCFSA